MRRNNFRVIRRNGAGYHHHARITHVFRAMVEENRGAQIRQLLSHRIRRQVRTADLITFVGQNFGNTAHTSTTDADKVNVPNATHFGHYGTQFCQLLCIHSLAINFLVHAMQKASPQLRPGSPAHFISNTLCGIRYGCGARTFCHG